MWSKLLRKIKKEKLKNQTISAVFEEFVRARTADGVSPVTLQTYHNHLHCISNHLDIEMPLAELTRDDLNTMVVSMRQSGLAHNSVSSYARVFRTFLNWCKQEGKCDLEMPHIVDKEVVKDTYSDDDLMKLLKKPDKECTFGEYRSWVIVNFLMNCGCRASSIRNIQNQDVDLEKKQIIFRHTKNGKMQTVPLCSLMVSILSEYMQIREGKAEEYLFCNQYGEMLTDNALRLSITKYNKSRGVENTSIG